MKSTKFLSLFCGTFAAFVCLEILSCSPNLLHAQDVIVSYDSTNPNSDINIPSPNLPAAEQADGVSALNLARGSGLVPNGGITLNSSSWSSSNSLDLNSNDYLSWGWEADGQAFDLTSLRLQYDRNPNGPAQMSIAVSVNDGSFEEIFNDTFVDPSDDEATIDLTAFTNVAAAEFRLFGYDTVTESGTFDLEEFQSTPSRSVEIRGFAVAIPEPAATIVVLGMSLWAATIRRRNAAR